MVQVNTSLEAMNIKFVKNKENGFLGNIRSGVSVMKVYFRTKKPSTGPNVAI